MANVGRAYKNWPKYDDDLVNKAYVDEATKNAEISGDLEKQISKNSEDIKTANSDIVNLRNEKLDANVYDKFIAEEYDPLASQINTTVKQVDVEYYLSDEATKLVGGEWSTEAPPWEDGKYMWSRQKVTYVDGTYITRNATCISGATGPAGENAEVPETDKTFSGTDSAILENSGDNILPLLNIYGKSTQKTRLGTNKFNASLIPTTTGIVVNEDGSQILMPLATSSNGFTDTHTKLSVLAPELKVGDVVYLSFNTNSPYNKFIYLIAPQLIWYCDTSITITEEMLNSKVGLYGNRFTGGETEQVTISNFRIVLGENNVEWEQFGATPSPDFPSKIESVGYENLFNPNNLTDNVYGPPDGIFYTHTGFWLTDYIEVDDNKSYVLNYIPSGVHYYDKDKNHIAVDYDSKNFTTKDSAKYIRINYQRNTVAYENANTVMMNKGTKLLSYIPYGKYGIEVETVGKNLFNKENIIDGWIRASDNKYWNETGTFSCTDYIKVKPNTTYTLNLHNATSLASGGIMEYDNKKAWLNIGLPETNKLMTFTTSENTYYIRFTVRNESVDYIQLEEGSVETEYTPYQERTSLIVLNAPLRSLPNGVKDIAYIRNNKLYVDRYVGSLNLDGSENWSYDSQGSAGDATVYGAKTLVNDYIGNSKFATDVGNINLQTDTFKITNTFAKSVEGMNGGWGTYIYVKLFATRLSALSDTAVKTFFANNNTNVIYQLSEPITETYPDIFDLRTFDNCTNLFVLSNLKSDIDGKYYTPFKGDIGQSGKGVSSIIEEYSTSESNETPPISGWSTVQPKWSSEYYIWTRSKIIYKDPESIEYTEPICSTLNDAYDDLSLKINGKIESYYQNTDPSSSWSTAIEKESHVGDIWYNTSNQKTFVYYKDSSTNPVSYSWKWQNVPMELLNTVEGKSTIYSGIIPVNYKKGEYWIIPLDCYTNSYSLTSQEGTFSVGMIIYVGKYELEVLTVDSSNKIATYKINVPTKSNYSLAEVITDENITLTITSVSDFELPTDCYGGTTCVAISDGTTYNKSHWTKRNHYIPQDKADSFVSKDYVRDEILHVSSETTKQINDLDNSFGIKITTVETTIKGNKDELDNRIGGFENTTNKSIEDLQKIDTDLADKLDKEYKYLINELQVLNDKITAYIRSTGGNNLLRNAVGFKNDLYWSGDKSTYTEQEYRTYSGKTITINFRYKKTGTSASKVVLGYYVGTTFTQVYEIFNKSTAVNEWSEVEFSYTSTVNNPVIRFNGYFTAVQDNDAEANGASGSKLVFNNGLIITDLMIGYGEKQPWTPYFDEVYGKTYTIDQYGFDMIEDASSKKMHLDTNSIDFLDNNGNVEGVFSKAQTITDNITANTSFNMGNLNMIKIDNNNIIEY